MKLQYILDVLISCLLVSSFSIAYLEDAVGKSNGRGIRNPKSIWIAEEGVLHAQELAAMLEKALDPHNKNAREV